MLFIHLLQFIACCYRVDGETKIISVPWNGSTAGSSDL